MEPTLFLLPLSIRLPFVVVDKQSTEREGERERERKTKRHEEESKNQREQGTPCKGRVSILEG